MKPVIKTERFGLRFAFTDWTTGQPVHHWSVTYPSREEARAAGKFYAKHGHYPPASDDEDERLP